MVLVVVLAALVADSQFSTQSAKPASVSETEFSAERAMSHVTAIAGEPRPQGSDGATRARAYIMNELEALGLTAELQETVAVRTTEGTDAVFGASVVNVMARIPGTDSTGAIVINGHFDSGPNALGAGDCGSCVATVLETARALLAGEPLRNDVILLFADGEETQLFGGREFVQKHPWAADVAFALNLESQGTNGPAVFYVSSPNDADVAARVLEYAPQPIAYSFLASLVRGLVGGSDLDSFTDEDIPGAGFAFFEMPQYYHTALDSPERLSPDSVQHLGSYALAVTRGLGNDDLGELEADSNAIYSTIGKGTVVRYPALFVLPFTILLTLGLGAVLLFGRRSHLLTLRRVAAAGGLAIAVLILTAIIVTAIWVLIRVLNADYHIFLVGVTYQDHSYLAAFVLLATAMVLAVQFWGRRHANRLEWAVGTAMVWWLLAVVVAVPVPTFSPLFAWPLAASLVVLGFTVVKPALAERPWVRVAGFSLAAVVVVIVLYPAVMLFQTLSGRMEAIAGIPAIALPVLIASIALLPLLPLVPFPESRVRWWLPAGVALGSFMILGWNNVTSGFDDDHPKTNMVMYHLDAEAGVAKWLTVGDGAVGRGRSGLIDEWTKQFIGDDPEPVPVAGWSAGPEMTLPGYSAEAPLAGLAAPQATVMANEISDGARRLTVRFSSPRGATNIRIFVDQPLGSLTVEGSVANVTQLDQSDGIWIHYLSLPPEGITVEMTVNTTEPIAFDLQDWSQGLPELDGLTFEPRPSHMVASAHDLADTTMVTTSYVVE